MSSKRFPTGSTVVLTGPAYNGLNPVVTVTGFRNGEVLTVNAEGKAQGNPPSMVRDLADML